MTAYLKKNAELLRAAVVPPALRNLVAESAQTLSELASATTRPEDLERHLTVLEEKLFAGLLTNTPDAELIAVRAEADRDIAPYRSKMGAAQIEQLHRQYVNKRLLERAKLPRLSLFYM